MIDFGNLLNFSQLNINIYISYRQIILYLLEILPPLGFYKYTRIAIDIMNAIIKLSNFSKIILNIFGIR